MLTKLSKVGLLASAFTAALILSGCVLPEKVKQVEVDAVPTNIHSAKQVEKAILIAGHSLSWDILLTDENQAVATKATTKNRIVVTIPFSAKGYKIQLKETTNMSYNAEKGTISPSYNKEITDFDNAIQANLYAR